MKRRVWENEVVFVSPNKLKSNPLQKEWFGTRVKEHLDELADDIKTNGIDTALKVMPDNTLLCGHNRLIVAKTLRLKTVPVIYTKKMLSKSDQELKIISDNVLRRHLPTGKKSMKRFYERLFPGFHDRVMLNPLSNPKMAISAKKFAEKTGLSIPQAKVKLAEIRRNEKRKVSMAARKHNTSIHIGRVDGIKKYFTRLKRDMAGFDKKTNKMIINIVNERAKELEEIFTPTKRKKKS